jgi:YHS domain-containing protein
VQLRASGALAQPAPLPPEARLQARQSALRLAEAVDPVCGMTVLAGSSALPFSHEGRAYYFCCAGCRRTFEQDPDAHIKAVLP